MVELFHGPRIERWRSRDGIQGYVNEGEGAGMENI